MEKFLIVPAILYNLHSMNYRTEMSQLTKVTKVTIYDIWPRMLPDCCGSFWNITTENGDSLGLVHSGMGDLAP